MKFSLFLLTMVFSIMNCLASGYPDDLFFYTKLDSVADITAPQVGVSGAANSAQFQAGLHGNALRGWTASGQGRVEFPLTNGLPIEKGCIEFCAKIVSDKDTYSQKWDPQFFCIMHSGLSIRNWNLHLVANDGCGRHGFNCNFVSGLGVSQFDGYGYAYQYSTAYDTKDPKAWHHYAIAWNTNGVAGSSNALCVYLDGDLLMSTPKSQLDVPSFVDLMSRHMVLAFAETNSEVLLDEFRIWSTDRTTFPEGPIDPETELPVVSEVTASQHYPWDGSVDVAVTFEGGASNAVAQAECVFWATNSATSSALNVARITAVDGAAGNRVSQSTTYKYKMGAENTLFTAQFKKESALAVPVLNWNAATNLTAGVSYAATPKVSGEAAVKITSVTGLPKGLKYKSGKVSGVPTVAKTYTVSVKVALKTNAKKTWTLKQKLVVGALPAWAKGTYVGGCAEETVTNQVVMTVGSTGKVSGKINFADKVWTFTAGSYAALDAETGTIKATAVSGKTKKAIVINVGADELGGWVVCETAGFAFEARQNLWRTDETWMLVAAELVWSIWEDDDITATFTANGVASVKLMVGANTFSASATLVPTKIEDEHVEGVLFVYFAPNTKKRFKGAVRVFQVSSF